MFLTSKNLAFAAQPASLAFSDGGSRHLLQFDSNTTNSTNAPFLLARSRTDRPDPLRRLKKYTRGYNLSSVHYEASAMANTGLPGWILALVWAALGMILLLTLCCMCCCYRHRTTLEYSHGRLGYVLSIIALVTFTLAAIAGSIFLYYAQSSLNHELRNTLNYVVNQSEITEANLREAQSNCIQYSAWPGLMQGSIRG